MPGDDFLVERVRQALADYMPRRIEEPKAVPAAVLILLYPREGQPHVLFTQRTDQVEHHKGQISFPGGAHDHNDGSLAHTALRESFEEVGVSPEHVEIIGQLDDILTVSNFAVSPYVGLLNFNADYPFVLNMEEVAEIVQVPLNLLLDERNMELEVREHQGKPVLTPAFTYNGHRIWGATARILHQFIELLR